MSLRDQILSADDLPREAVECPEWGTTVYVRTVTGTERDAFEAAGMVKKGKTREFNMQQLRARMAVLTACDADGKPLFGPGDVQSLGAKSARVLERIFQVAQRLNGWSDEDIEELAKNSGSGPSAASGSS